MSRPEVPARDRARPDARTLRMHTFGSSFDRLLGTAQRAGIEESAVVLPAEGVVRAHDGVGLHYLEWPGPVREPLILLMHGGGLQAHSYDVAGLLLRPHGRVVALDLRGHGDSEWAAPDAYGTDAIAADIDSVVGALGASRVVVVAHSLSGMAALVWAARRPRALTGLVIVDVGPQIGTDVGHSVGNLVASRPVFTDLAEAEQFYAQVVSSIREAATAGIVNTLAWTDDGRLTTKHDPHQFHPDRARIHLGDDLRAAARQVACPTLVLRGERSRLFTDEGAAELAALLPTGRWEQVPDAGHSIQSSNPRGLAEAVARFLHHDLRAPGPDGPVQEKETSDGSHALRPAPQR